jgi:hypothetical protein
MSNGFIYVVDAHFIDTIEEKKYPGPKCLWAKCQKLLSYAKRFWPFQVLIRTNKTLVWPHEFESFQGSTFCLFVVVQPWNI